MDNSISIILKVCNACNLKCKHCYESADSFCGTTNLMSLSMLEKIFSLAQSEYKHVRYVWFGGEPLLCGLDYFRDAISLQKQYNSDNIIKNHIQTNGTLLSEEFADFFKSEGFAVSISYDAQFNEYLRQNTAQTLNGIANCKAANIPCGILSTIHAGNYDKQIEMYHHIKQLGCPMKFNPIFPLGAALDNTGSLLNIKAYVDETVRFFNYWCEDETAVPVSSFVQYIRLFLNLPGRNCVYGACLYKWISIEPDGSVFPCSRFSDQRYSFGRIQDTNSLASLFKTAKYCQIVSDAIQRRLLCRDNCQLYFYCNGGCNSAAAMECGISKCDFQLCSITKLIFPRLFNQVTLLESQVDIKNPIVRQLLNSSEQSQPISIE